MNIQSKPQKAPVWLTADSGDFEEFRRLTAQTTAPRDVPHAAEIVRNIPVYEGRSVDACATDPTRRQALMEEWATVLSSGAGIIVIRAAYADTAVLDRASAVFDRIIAEEKAAAKGGGDHFAKPGANDRVWNSLEKHCNADPSSFAEYYSCHTLALASEAWLGPNYQMTAQVNRVNPGGAAQVPHRDYHLGFMSAAQMARYPAHIHAVSPVLTLQGAVAHVDMPLESGPTMLLPFSQQYFEGYLAFSRPEFQAHFAEHHVQLPLAKGDVVFFNPAVMHGAGTNRTADIFRLVNLLQVSSAFGRAMETVNRDAMCRALYPMLLNAPEGIDLANVIAASAEGYPFPTNLDSNPPVGGLAPKSQAELMRAALAEGQDPSAFCATLDALLDKNRS
ncbi:phytanoyl-CoA dioxygenase family protein [Thetidibacter halocola]|uniref:Phytanoyl-CoA dioxygenase family protein n=1 Tax=Thetidibacter halocola TaxID=2827239 RepID=A0A8J7WDQ5_9RHOB|nr:phytanoyl-CoA dioxygenase family protein [Thetidibacter halocola]MBS0123816.1 phytanoyl-CoA dioxygenase family protein [Thetidibacter halocola]